jgi:hypothetical protein
VDVGGDAGPWVSPHTEFMSLRSLTVVAALTALSLATGAQARPLTTTPSLILDVHITITNTRIVLDRHSAPRGVQARFIIKNTGTKAHNFTLNGRTTLAGVRQHFSRTLKPQQRVTVRLFLDQRARVPYFDSLPADRSKPGMKGFFVIS